RRPLLQLCLVLAGWLVVGIGAARAQSTDAARADSPAVATEAAAPVFAIDSGGHVTIRATRIPRGLMKTDGALDEAVYGQVPALTQFVQQEPDHGAPITQKTEAWVLYDDDNVYVACRCWETEPEKIVANDMRRDSPNLRQNDNFAVELDTFHDRRNGFLFYVTPLGGMYDGLTADERTNNADWNTVWHGRVGRFEGGWVAEMAIPFKSLRFAPGRQQTWGINMRRVLRGRNEWAYITPMQRAWGATAIFRTSAAATLVGLEAPQAAKNLELKPYAIARLTTDRLAKPPVRDKVEPDVGLDVKYGLTKSLTADFTYNTDFAQVEEDEAQVNLTRFSLFFPEKREFFLEGQGTFAFGVGGGIGGGASGTSTTAGTGGANANTDAPTIFYSRRIGLSSSRVIPIVGGGRLTGRAGPWNIGALAIAADEEPTANVAKTTFTVLRVRRDVFRRSYVGGILTERSVSTLGRGGNGVWGIDGSFALGENTYLSGYLSQSKTDGRHGHDLSYRSQFNFSGDRYGLNVDHLAVGDNFNPEVGFLRREDFQQTIVQTRFSPRPKRSTRVRRYFFETNTEYTTDNDFRLESREVQGSMRAELQNSDILGLSYSRLFEALPAPFRVSDTATIPVGSYAFDNLVASLTLGQQHHVAGAASLERGRFYGGDKTTVAYRGRVSVTPRLSAEPNISLNWIDLPQGGFVTSVVGLRTLYTVTPRMFAAALVQYNSSTTSVSANLRFRWEYRPGSELFVVYTEGRDTALVGRPVLENRGFVVKINRLFRY
ncbi:MAG: DUF5916 domain-containing protein, partial [Vicinamibacterales bacterium]